MLNLIILAAASGSTLARELEKQPVPPTVPLAYPDHTKHADLPEGFKLMEAA